MVLLHPIDNLGNLLSLARSNLTDVQVERLLVEGINSFGISEEFHNSIGYVQVTLLGKDFVDVLLPEVNDKFDEVSQFLLSIILVVRLKLDSVLVTLFTYLNILVELLVVGVVQQDKIVLGDDREVSKCPSLLVGVSLTASGGVILVHVSDKVSKTFFLNVLRASLEVGEFECVEHVLD